MSTVLTTPWNGWDGLPSDVRYEWNQSLANLNTIRKNLPELRLLQTALETHDCATNIWVYGSFADLTLKVKTFADAAPVLRWLAQRGLRQSQAARICKSEGSATYHLGDFIQVKAVVIIEGTCRKVVVGYTDPIPRYEVMCDDEPAFTPHTLEEPIDAE